MQKLVGRLILLVMFVGMVALTPRVALAQAPEAAAPAAGRPRAALATRAKNPGDASGIAAAGLRGQQRGRHR